MMNTGFVFPVPAALFPLGPFEPDGVVPGWLEPLAPSSNGVPAGMAVFVCAAGVPFPRSTNAPVNSTRIVTAAAAANHITLRVVNLRIQTAFTLGSDQTVSLSFTA